MSDWVLIPCLKALFAEFDRIAPARDRASDGSIGDQRHQDEVSDHNPDETGSVPIHDADHVNEIHAIDVDNNLREPDLTMEKVVQFLLARCRSGAEKRLRYIIYNRRIWSASSGWVQKTYTGASPHTEHAHFSASYVSSLEASTASWHLEDIDMPSAEEIANVVVAKLHGVNANTLARDPKTGAWDSGDGRATWWHTINGKNAWQVLYGTYKLAEAMAGKMDVPLSQVLAAVGDVDEQVLSALGEAGRSDEDVAASLRAALGDRAAAVGRLLASA